MQVMMVKKMQETDTENEIREAYRVFDKERTGRCKSGTIHEQNNDSLFFEISGARTFIGKI